MYYQVHFIVLVLMMLFLMLGTWSLHNAGKQPVEGKESDVLASKVIAGLCAFGFLYLGVHSGATFTPAPAPRSVTTQIECCGTSINPPGPGGLRRM